MRTDDRLSAIEERLDNLEAQRRCLSMRQDQLEGRVGAHRADLTDLRNILGAYRAEVAHVHSSQERLQGQIWRGEVPRNHCTAEYRARMRGLALMKQVFDKGVYQGVQYWVQSQHGCDPSDNFIIVPEWLYDEWVSRLCSVAHQHHLLSREQKQVMVLGQFALIADGQPCISYLAARP